MKRLRYEFALANLMGIRPWEIDLLTVEQLDRACSAIDAYVKQSQQPQDG